MGIAIEFTLWSGVDPEEFKIIDQGSKRGAQDLVQINGYSHERIRAPAAKILLIIESGNGSYKPPPQFVSDRVSLLNERLDRAAYWGEKLQRVQEDGKITTGTAAAVAYYMIQESGAPQDKIDKFFTTLFDGRDAETVTPACITALLKRLKGALAVGHDVSTNIKRAGAIILAWNLYRSRKTPKKINLTWLSASSLPNAAP